MRQDHAEGAHLRTNLHGLSTRGVALPLRLRRHLVAKRRLVQQQRRIGTGCCQRGARPRVAGVDDAPSLRVREYDTPRVGAVVNRHGHQRAEAEPATAEEPVALGTLRVVEAVAAHKPARGKRVIWAAVTLLAALHEG
eukprot:2571600-Pleurochrysis_carterae.AAC.2